MSPEPIDTTVTRRTFLKAGAVAGAIVTLGEVARPGLLAAAGTGPGRCCPAAPTPSWIDKPMRWAQLTLVEDDPGKFDLAFWLDYFKRTQSDAVCLSGGGCVAYYPTQVPMHHRSRWLGDRDVLGELVAGCRKLGMVVIVRTDPHATYDDVAEAHPDWIAVDEAGRRRRHWASPEMWVTCGLGPYNFEFMTEVKREIVSRYRVDGIFINRWEGSGMCYCEHCRRNFLAASGLELPRTEDRHDPARQAYTLWRQRRLFDLWQTWDRAVREINPDACVIPNTGGGATSTLDMKEIGQTRAHDGGGPPGAPGPDGAVGDRDEREGVSRDARPQAGHRPLQRGRRGAVPLEGLGPERRRDPAVGGGPGRQRHAPVVHEVQRRAARRAVAPAGRRHLPPPGRLGALPAQRAPARARGGRLLAADRVVRGRAVRGSHQRLVPGAGRVARPVRDGARPPAGRRPPRPVQDAHPAEHRGALGRAVPADRGVRPRRRQRHRDAPDQPVRRVRVAAQDLRAGRPVRRGLRRDGGGADAERLPAARARRHAAPSAPPRARDRPAHHPRGLARRGDAARGLRPDAADAHPELPRPADGDGLSARARRPTSRRCSSARTGREAAWSTSPGTSTARSGKC